MATPNIEVELYRIGPVVVFRILRQHPALHASLMSRASRGDRPSVTVAGHTLRLVSEGIPDIQSDRLCIRNPAYPQYHGNFSARRFNTEADARCLVAAAHLLVQQVNSWRLRGDKDESPLPRTEVRFPITAEVISA